MSRGKALPAAVFVVLVSALVGGFFGRSALATQDRVAERYKVFTAALSAIENQYVEKVDSERLVYSAIGGMVQTLDPHSNFLDLRTYAQLRERQEGRYYGLGITIQVIDGDITVVSLFEGSPEPGIHFHAASGFFEAENTQFDPSPYVAQPVPSPVRATPARR